MRSTDPAQSLIKADGGLGDLDHDLPEVRTSNVR